MADSNKNVVYTTEMDCHVRSVLLAAEWILRQTDAKSSLRIWAEAVNQQLVGSLCESTLRPGVNQR
eukprot:1887237-Pyramimonas_sp.AAC.1